MRRFITYLLLAMLMAFSAEPSFSVTPVHEGLIGAIGEGIVPASVRERPPGLPRELRPEKGSDFDENAIWLSGYWIWDPEKNSYAFVKGIYRVPPPGMKWQPPRWIERGGYWIRLKGYWHPIDRSLARLQQTPSLCKVEEKPTDSPLSPCLYAPGFWVRDLQGGLKRSIPGRWVVLEKDRTYTPADFVFDGEGFILVPPYFDLPLEKRFAVKAGEGNSTNLDALLVELFLSYPDYQFFLQEHFVRNPAYWLLKGSVPSWWLWKGSTLLSRTESWWLFWWWTHPGFPQPEWINPELAAKIYPPSTALVETMQRKTPPSIVMSWGAAELDDLLRVINSHRHNFINFIPDSEDVKIALAGLEPESPDQVHPLQPEGKHPYLSLTGNSWPRFNRTEDSSRAFLFSGKFLPFGVEEAR
ncbi:hypothetical protein [Estrella lausannensis]|uniref:Putative secreted protein n=1 Tax=Estrella lausannensis TaxID=483423 RepID=A0A0H5DRM2_9BACT|nr:hypothetical protein [Estrella lausannensis]CRX38354.1 putative secreted protein [Estrella lausannensis]